MNRSGIATAARRYLIQTNTTFVGTTLMFDEINQSLMELNTDSEFNRVDATISIKTGARERVLPTGVMDIYRVRLGTGTDRNTLSWRSSAGLTRDEGDWEGGTAGTPTNYYTDGQYIGFDPRPRARTTWTNAKVYAVGNIVIPSATDNGFTYKCTVAGTSAATEPTWPTTLDGTIGEGASRRPTWKQDGHSRVWLRVLKNPAPLSTATATPSWLPERFHRTIAKKTALNLAGGYMADGDVSVPRMQRLYEEYLRDAQALRSLSERRSKEHVARFTPKGYDNFFRRL